MNLVDWLRRRPEGFWVAVIAFVAFAVGTVLSWVFWDWLRDGESGSSTVRNVGLLVGAVIAMVLAVWRSRVAGRQAAAAQFQAETALKQAGTAQQRAETADRGLLNERYQRGAEMLGSDVLAVRMGGIYALHQLAREHPGTYHIQIMRLFCAYVRNPTIDKNMPDPGVMTRKDVQEVMDAIAYRSDRQLKIERDNIMFFDLSHVKLRLVGLVNANLGSATFSHSDLAHSYMDRANLSGAVLYKADLYRAHLAEADLSRAILEGANLNEADLTNTKFSSVGRPFRASGLTQSQLDLARADPKNPPHLEGVADAETGTPLVWRGRPLNDGVVGDS